MNPPLAMKSSFYKYNGCGTNVGGTEQEWKWTACYLSSLESREWFSRVLGTRFTGGRGEKGFVQETRGIVRTLSKLFPNRHGGKMNGRREAVMSSAQTKTFKICRK